MKRRILGTIAAGAAAVLMLSGFDSAMTVVDLQTKMQEALAAAPQVSFVMNGTANANMIMVGSGEEAQTTELPLEGNVVLSCEMVKEPFQMHLGGSFLASAMGQGADGSMEAYIVANDDGSGNAYINVTTNGTESGWSAETIDAESFSKVTQYVNSSLSGDLSSLNTFGTDESSIDMSALTDIVEKYRQTVNDSITIAPESVVVNGKECYELTGSLGGELLNSMIADIFAATGEGIDESSQAIVQTLLGGINIQMTTDVDVSTLLTTFSEIDFSSSDFSAITDLFVSLMGGTGDESITIDVSELNLTCDFNYDPVSITVPQEALDAPVSGDNGDLESLVSGLEDQVTGDETEAYGGYDVSEEAVLNEDGTYHLEYEDFDGKLCKADIAVPEGMELSYGTTDYISFTTPDYKTSVGYSLYAMSTPQETVETQLDTSFMEEDTEYSDISTTGVLETALSDGTLVYYGTITYTYDEYKMGGTYVALTVGDTIVFFQIDKLDDDYNVTDVTEEEIITYASCAHAA